MFTHATKKFGVWKEENENNVMRYKINSRQIVFALGMAAFISWILFIITIRVRQEFFLIESSARSHMKLKNIKDMNSGFFFRERKAVLTHASMHQTHKICIK